MRDRLREMEEVRSTFVGEFVRHGLKSGYKGSLPTKTLLLRDVRNLDGELLTDHLWFNDTKGFRSLGNLVEGDLIQFDARVKMYEKGYKGYREDVYDCPIELDYKLSHPTNVMRYERGLV